MSLTQRSDGRWYNAAGFRAQVVVNADGSAVGGGSLRVASVELTRPANTTAYDAGDAVTNSTSASTPLVLADVVSANAGAGRIVGATLKTSKKDFSGARIRAHLFNAAPTAISNDNAQHQIRYADKASELGYIDFPAMTIGTDTANSTGAISQSGSLYLPFACAAADNDLYVVLETLDVVTPASGQTFYLTVYVE